MHSARDMANDMARTVLAQHAAVMVYTAKNQGLLEDELFRSNLSRLRTLVGPLHFEEYLAVSKTLWGLFDKSQVSDYLLAVHAESRKIIKGTKTGKRAKLSQEELDERWVDASMFPPQEAQWLSDKELWGWLNQFEDMEKFSELLVGLTVERGVAQTVEDLGGAITEDELLRKLREMDLTMTELRLLQLVLELIVDYSVKPIELPDEPPFILPEGVTDGAS